MRASQSLGNSWNRSALASFRLMNAACERPRWPRSAAQFCRKRANSFIGGTYLADDTGGGRNQMAEAGAARRPTPRAQDCAVGAAVTLAPGDRRRRVPVRGHQSASRDRDDAAERQLPPAPRERMIGYFEDIVVGRKSVLGSHEFTRDAIIAFARAWDPQPFHVDEAAGRVSIFGSLCASGWHTGCVAMRLIVEAREKFRAERRQLGETLPPLGVSPGMMKMRWPNPTRPGDVVTYSSEVRGSGRPNGRNGGSRISERSGSTSTDSRRSRSRAMCSSPGGRDAPVFC